MLKYSIIERIVGWMDRCVYVCFMFSFMKAFLCLHLTYTHDFLWLNIICIILQHLKTVYNPIKFRYLTLIDKLKDLTTLDPLSYFVRLDCSGIPEVSFKLECSIVIHVYHSLCSPYAKAEYQSPFFTAFELFCVLHLSWSLCLFL